MISRIASTSCTARCTNSARRNSRPDWRRVRWSTITNNPPSWVRGAKSLNSNCNSLNYSILLGSTPNRSSYRRVINYCMILMPSRASWRISASALWVWRRICESSCARSSSRRTSNSTARRVFCARSWKTSRRSCWCCARTKLGSTNPTLSSTSSSNRRRYSRNNPQSKRATSRTPPTACWMNSMHNSRGASSRPSRSWVTCKRRTSWGGRSVLPMRMCCLIPTSRPSGSTRCEPSTSSSWVAWCRNTPMRWWCTNSKYTAYRRSVRRCVTTNKENRSWSANLWVCMRRSTRRRSPMSNSFRIWKGCRWRTSDSSRSMRTPNSHWGYVVVFVHSGIGPATFHRKVTNHLPRYQGWHAPNVSQIAHAHDKRKAVHQDIQIDHSGRDWARHQNS